jgi:hypothetical protein
MSCGRSGNPVGRPGILPGRPCRLVSSYVLPIGSFMVGGSDAPQCDRTTQRGRRPRTADGVRSAIERYRDAVNCHDIDAVVAAFTDDGLIDCTPPPNGERYEGFRAISALFDCRQSLPLTKGSAPVPALFNTGACPDVAIQQASGA